MRRLLTWLAGALGAAALGWRLVRQLPRRRQPVEVPTVEPADALRAKLEQARATPDDREEFDAAEGIPVDEVEQPRSLEERRRAVHDKAQEALGHMRQQDDD